MQENSILDRINKPQDLKALSKEELTNLCEEVRDEIVNIVSKTGGHLGAGLGVIELTIALHYVFNAPDDKIIWDVGHQAYPHKLITERKKLMHTIRQKDGLSGFTKRAESIYDPFGAGHSSTSISAALGFAVANNLKQGKHKSIAVIGDGAMSAGMAYEAINNAGHVAHKNLIIILNDNDMSIDRPTGALSNYLAKLISSDGYLTIKNFAKDILDKLPEMLKNSVVIAKQRAKEVVTDSISGNNLFEHLGLNYIGPVDGHNLSDLIQILDNINNIEHDKPFLIHVVTKKGYGYKPAENSKDKYHGVVKFDIKTGEQNKKASKDSYTKVFAKQLIESAKKDDKILAITAAMPSGTGLDLFAKEFPHRCFDVGIAEQHAVTFAAGLACDGYKPYVAIYSTFLQRAYDQIIHDVAVQNLPVRFAIDRAGLVGADGATHAGSFDISYLINLPNFIVSAPSDEQELKNIIYTSTYYNNGPFAFRYPRGEVSGLTLKKAQKVEIGKANIIAEGNKILFLSLGTKLDVIKKVAKRLKQNKNLTTTIIDMRFAKPLDEDVLLARIPNHDIIVTIEDGAMGGFAAQINNFIFANNLQHQKQVKNFKLPDFFQDQASPEEMYKQAKLDDDSIYQSLAKIL
ncbi:MAG: 1-deoxy-D-xylulose-5-phosphate synthase [Alphaproteobacteria bacterium]|jgi:1-deoxy-D-xylulose-5-phosphate synthase|nr:1-deoxy-D-xylulose-5-phosphate synthase [Alphaproteobacteria bacterium]